MKKRLFTLIFLLLSSIFIYSQTQVSFRLTNPRILYRSNITAGGNVQNLEWDVEMKAASANTRAWAIQVILTHSAALTNLHFSRGTLFPALDIDGGIMYNATYNGNSGNFNLFITSGEPITLGAGNEVYFTELPTIYTAIGTLRAQILDPTGVAGLTMIAAGMDAQEFEKTFAGAPWFRLYSPVVYDNSMSNLYLGRVYCTKHGFTQYGGNVANTQFLDWSVAQNTSIWDGNAVLNSADATTAVANNLRLESGTSLTLPTLTIPSNKWLTVNNTLTNPGTAANLVVQNGGSLIQSTAGVLGTAESTITVPEASQWHFVSSPIANGTINLYFQKYLQKYTESTNIYQDLILPTTIPLNVMQGYAAYGIGWNNTPIGYTTSYAGTLNTGTLSISGLTRADATTSRGWNLVGNPYTSTIDWDLAKALAANSGLFADAIYVEKAGTWATYISGVGANGGTKNVPPGQGFFIQKSAVNGSVAFTLDNTTKLHSSVAFLKSAETVTNLIRLEASGNGYKDESVVRFMPDATNEFDSQYDALFATGRDLPELAQLYTKGGSASLSINTLAEGTLSVPVGLHASIAGAYTITATEINEIPIAILEDTKTAVFTDLKLNSYTFNFTPGENETRFILHFGTLNTNELENSKVNIYSYQQTVFINLLNEVEGDIFIYNVAGQLVNFKASAKGSNEMKLRTIGTYIVKVITKDNTVVRKVYIQQ